MVGNGIVGLGLERERRERERESSILCWPRIVSTLCPPGHVFDLWAVPVICPAPRSCVGRWTVSVQCLDRRSRIWPMSCSQRTRVSPQSCSYEIISGESSYVAANMLANPL